MFSLNIKIAHHELNTFLKTYQNIDKFLPYCKQCNNYNHKWSCPPLSFEPQNYLAMYQYIYLVAVQINYDQITIDRLTTKEDVSSFTRKTLRQIKNQTAMKLLSLEQLYPHTLSLSSGGCSYCCKCSRINNQPCKKPDKLRYSLDSFGIDLGAVTEKIFDIKLLWGLDKLPKYHTLIHALVSQEILNEKNILDYINKM